jgi:hypothetical protein
LKPGHIHHARWLTKASRLLRLYVTKENPSKSLQDLAKYIMNVYIPMYFNIKFRSSSTYGSVHFSRFILYSQYLPPQLLTIVQKVIQSNAYFAHPENIIFAMLYDQRPHIRRLACERILKARENEEDIEGVRPFECPRINFDCNDYVDMIDWDTVTITEPPFTRNKSHHEISEYMTSAAVFEDLHIPCHIQATERHIQIVTSAAQHVSPGNREGFVVSRIAARNKRPKTDTRRDFDEEADD